MKKITTTTLLTISMLSFNSYAGNVTKTTAVCNTDGFKCTLINTSIMCDKRKKRYDLAQSKDVCDNKYVTCYMDENILLEDYLSERTKEQQKKVDDAKPHIVCKYKIN